MTEQEKTSAVVEETREAVDTTSQPVATEKKSKNNTALILSAVAIAIALAAGIMDHRQWRDRFYPAPWIAFASLPVWSAAVRFYLQAGNRADLSDRSPSG